MESLCADEELDLPLTSSWLRFQEQRGTGASVLDGYIAQDSVKIGVETKLTDSFDSAQILRHMKVFGEEKHKILILLTPSLNDSAQHALNAVRGACNERAIHLIATTFDSVVRKAKDCLSEHEEEMLSLVDDFEDFCSEMNLLPRDKSLMLVPPCGQSYNHNIRFLLYHCPAAWSRRKAAYVGIYYDRSVRAIGRVAKILHCTIDLQARTVVPLAEHAGQSLTKDECDRLLGAADSAQQQEWDITHDTKFYLLDGMESTDFKKSTPRGIQGHRYIDLEGVFGDQSVPSTVSALAASLRTHQWQ
jgi:hypothetical protein